MNKNTLNGKPNLNEISKTITDTNGVIVDDSLGGILVSKVVTRLVARFSSKALVGFIPFLGIAVSGGINYWSIESISDAAKSWYAQKVKIIKELNTKILE